MSKKLMLIIAGIVVAGGVAAFVVTNKDDNSGSSNTTQSSAQTQQKNSDDNKIKGSLSSLSGDGKARECTFTSSGPSGDTKGTMYSDGNKRGLMVINATTEQGNSGATNILTTVDKSYSWTTTNGQTFGLVFDNSTINANTPAETGQTSGAAATNQEFDMDCKDWKVDESKLTPPSDVNFQGLPVVPGV